MKCKGNRFLGKLENKNLVIYKTLFGLFAFLNGSQFGQIPKGDYLKSLKESPNYGKKSFENRSETPALSEGATFFSILKDLINRDRKRMKPAREIPSVKTVIQVDGKKILVDPVFSGQASPIPGNIKAFKGSDIYTTQDIPEIDYLFISHDHWDHLDYKTVVGLKPKVKQVICGLGVRLHFEKWGYDSSVIKEKDWDETIELDQSFTAHTVTSRHFSGRGLKRNTSLWMSYVLKTPSQTIFIGGDSGYDTHFKEVGDSFGPFDLVILENGQYDKSWKYIHMMPEEVLKAAIELKAKRVFPVHSGKFALANHTWDQPLKEVTSANEAIGLNLVTPIIGEKVFLGKMDQQFEDWWEGI